MIESSLKIAVWFFIGLILQDWFVWSAILLGFAVCRMIIGGIHAKSFLVCLVWTEMLLLTTWCVWLFYQFLRSEFVHIDYWMLGLLILFSIRILTIGIPIRGSKRLITKKRLLFTNVCFVIALLLAALLILDHHLWNDAFLVAMLMAMFFSMRTLTRIFIFFENIMGRLGK